MQEANEILNKNVEHRKAMLDLIASMEAIAFVGAGLSVPCGYPPWRTLLDQLRTEAEALATFQPPNGVTVSNPLDYAEAIQRHFEQHSGSLSRYYSVLGRAFGQKQCSEVQQRFVRVPFKGFVTTNYEDTLEQALALAGNKLTNRSVVVKCGNEDSHKVSEFLLSLDADAAQPRRVAHLHGIENQTKHIILSASDYRRAYGFVEPNANGQSQAPEWTLHRKLVWSLLATRRLVFFGCSLEDPYLTALLRAVADDLWNYGQPVHYAIISLDPDKVSSAHANEAQFLSKFGVQIVYYNNSDGTHTGLDQLINEALGRCGKSPGMGWLEDVNRETERSLRAHEN